ncbi:Otopetrin-2 [Channa argus]|uniref:Otopetrin-2 n=1 Tax=Channa argus TaxID=215402 RepID=A0A6G1QCH2_CHAAH|nr:Otopetrin-2 [Channa argus]
MTSFIWMTKMEEADLSNKTNESGQAANTREPHQDVSSSGVQGRKWGWLLSGILCVNVLILGCALVSANAENSENITTSNLQAFLIFFLLVTSSWIIYYVIFTARTKNAVVYKDGHAGPIWLRGGLVLFGLLSAIMDIFKIVSYVGYIHCDSAIKVAFPVVQLVFIVAQTYFLWVHAKDCVQLQKNFTCCGLMLTLSTNLVLWMTAVTEESLHQTNIPADPTNTTILSGRSLYIYKASYGDSKCQCSHTSCNIFKDAYYYLYPFNIEYSLFASAMAYVMWKNVGRVADGHTHHKVKIQFKDVFLGPVFGVLLVVAGLATFIVYEIEIKKNSHDNSKKDQVMMMHFVMNIVIVTLMSVSTAIGCAIYKVDHRKHVIEKNPTRSLDVGLLTGSSLGQFIISYFTTVATVATGVQGYLNSLSLTWAVLMVIQLGLQNIFIIEGLHREPFHEEHSVTVITNTYLQSSKDLSNLEGSGVNTKQNPEFTANGLHSNMVENRGQMWRRWVLKEVCVFLLLGNIILWIMPSFGARPEFDHETQSTFYSFSMWATIVNIGLPFGIFYRMHSVASLFEVFLNS